MPLMEKGKHTPIGREAPAQILPALNGVHGLVVHHLITTITCSYAEIYPRTS